jgi:hypothetical protein
MFFGQLRECGRAAFANLSGDALYDVAFQCIHGNQGRLFVRIERLELAELRIEH